MKCLPINVNIDGQQTLVVGGGQIAYRKVLSLLEYGAKVKVVSPELVDDFASLEGLEIVKREYMEGDIDGAILVISATSSQDANRMVYNHASSAGILVNVVDQPHLCTFIFPSVVSRGELIISISSGGASPTLSKELRHQITDLIGPEYGRHVEFLAEMREAVKETTPDIATRSQIAKQLAAPRFREIIESSGMDEARAQAKTVIEEILNSHT